MRRQGGWTILAVALSMVGLVVLSGSLLHRRIRDEATREALEQLEAVARLKAGQVIEWRQRLQGDVQANATGRFGMLAQEAAERGFDVESLDRLRRRMEERQSFVRYRDQILLDLQGNPILRLRRGATEVPEATRALALRTLAQNQALLGEPRLDGYGDPVLEAACPVIRDDGTPLGVLVHQEDLDRLLFPLLESWPLPSRTAETQVVMREDGMVLGLNRPRNSSSPPLTLRIPLSEREDLRVQAVLGTRGPLSGRNEGDGPRLFGHAAAIPNSRWVLVAWMEQDEALAKATWFFAMVWGMVLLAVACIALGGWVVWRGEQWRLVRRWVETERFRRLSTEALRKSPCSGDGILVADLRGNVVQMNLFAEHLTGWNGEEARGRTVREVLALVEKEEWLGARRASNSEESASFRVRMVRRDGAVRPIRMFTVPLREQDGSSVGVVTVFRDSTWEEEVESRARLIESRYRQLFEGTLVGVAWLDPEGRLLEVNEVFSAMVGRPRQDLTGMSWLDLVSSEDREVVRGLLERLFSGLREPVGADLRYLRPDGTLAIGRHDVQGLRDTEDRLVSVLVQVLPATGRT